MRQRKPATALLLILVSVSLLLTDVGIRWGCQHGKLSCHFLPDNPVLIPKEQTASGLSEQNYNSIMTEIQDAYSPVFNQTGHELVIQSDWSDDRVNSYATRDENQNPVLIAPGGMARHPLMTRDGLTAVFCHEVGHFLGGAPKIHRGDTDLLSWSSAEGEADYFAASRCMKVIFKDEAQNEKVVRALPLDRQEELEKRCSSFQCQRILEAARVVTSVFADVTASLKPSLMNSDPNPATTMIYTHPSPQCRLDTFAAGALCVMPPTAPFDDHDPAQNACVDAPGGRPSCWFVTIPVS